MLLSQDYRSFTLDKLLGIEAEYSLKHAQFVDIAMAFSGCFRQDLGSGQTGRLS